MNTFLTVRSPDPRMSSVHTVFILFMRRLIRFASKAVKVDLLSILHGSPIYWSRKLSRLPNDLAVCPEMLFYCCTPLVLQTSNLCGPSLTYSVVDWFWQRGWVHKSHLHNVCTSLIQSVKLFPNILWCNAMSMDRWRRACSSAWAFSISV